VALAAIGVRNVLRPMHLARVSWRIHLEDRR
jgi:hypothetical protein